MGFLYMAQIQKFALHNSYQPYYGLREMYSNVLRRTGEIRRGRNPWKGAVRGSAFVAS